MIVSVCVAGLSLYPTPSLWFARAALPMMPSVPARPS